MHGDYFGIEDYLNTPDPDAPPESPCLGCGCVECECDDPPEYDLGGSD